MDIPLSNDILINCLFTLFGFIIGNKLAIGRDKRKEFNSASEETREAIRQEIRNPCKNYCLPEIGEGLDYMFQYISPLNRLGYFVTSRYYQKLCKNAYYLDNRYNLVFHGNPLMLRILLKTLECYLKRK